MSSSFSSIETTGNQEPLDDTVKPDPQHPGKLGVRRLVALVPVKVPIGETPDSTYPAHMKGLGPFPSQSHPWGD